MNAPRTLITLSVLEIVILVGVLAVFLVVLAKKLGHIASTLHLVTCGVQSIEGHLTILAAVPMVNKTLDQIGNALPILAQTAAAKAVRR